MDIEAANNFAAPAISYLFFPLDRGRSSAGEKKPIAYSAGTSAERITNDLPLRFFLRPSSTYSSTSHIFFGGRKPPHDCELATDMETFMPKITAHTVIFCLLLLLVVVAALPGTHPIHTSITLLVAVIALANSPLGVGPPNGEAPIKAAIAGCAENRNGVCRWCPKIYLYRQRPSKAFGRRRVLSLTSCIDHVPSSDVHEDSRPELKNGIVRCRSMAFYGFEVRVERKRKCQTR